MEQLRALPGPAEPRDAGVGWDAVRRQVGSSLPPDFQDFVDTYGPCAVGALELVRLGRGGFLAGVTWEYERVRLLRHLWPEPGCAETTYPLFPEAGGLIPWATDGTTRYYWRPVGADPATWPVVMIPSHGGEVREVARSATDIILDFAAAGATMKATPLADDVAWLEMPLPDVPQVHGFLPQDYERLVAEYGPGTFGGVFRLLTPGGPDGFDSTSPRSLPAALSDPSGVVPWGEFTSGETCWWAPSWWTPNGWPVVVLDADGVGWQRLPYTATGFLHRWLAGLLDLPVLKARPEDTSFRSVAGTAATVHVPPMADTPGEDAPPHCAHLMSVVGPPPAPTVIDWSQVETELGSGLPVAYKWIAERYGRGTFADGLQVHWPSAAFPTDLVSEHRDLCETYRDIQDMDEDVLPGVGWFPDSGGLLHWAKVHNGGNVFWWDTSASDPDDWTVVVGYHEWEEWKPTPYRTAEFLVRYFTGTLGDLSSRRTAHLPPVFLPDDQRTREVAPRW
ncbi:SMI1/KNR4 family protein [Kutzneria buriramensis]|uniref:SUKH superfamily protein n=1 Tax=Kutzneria buriramensis TaxID=1045776 RepID=A0A3E0GU45_9PSEU|nr:SMI1/KNR4 family protein [Kutzneria buriramensis]REH27728.1 hypothetical protein BCF44_12831 [Kutzneria buriramensis]